jgi:ABC-type uncharacterized transport system permease subunit
VSSSRRRLAAAAGVVARPVLAIAVSLTAVAACLALLGYAPGPALRALAAGALGSQAACTATALKATPLLLTGLAVAICFRCGVWNIGAEGQLLTGALFATAVATRLFAGAPGAAPRPPRRISPRSSSPERSADLSPARSPAPCAPAAASPR